MTDVPTLMFFKSMTPQFATNTQIPLRLIPYLNRFRRTRDILNNLTSEFTMMEEKSAEIIAEKDNKGVIYVHC